MMAAARWKVRPETSRYHSIDGDVSRSERRSYSSISRSSEPATGRRNRRPSRSGPGYWWCSCSLRSTSWKIRAASGAAGTL